MWWKGVTPAFPNSWCFGCTTTSVKGTVVLLLNWWMSSIVHTLNNTKTCIICIGVVWLASSGVALNYRLASFMLIWQSGSTTQAHWSIHNINSPMGRENHPSSVLAKYLLQDTWLIVALTFENGNLFFILQTYKEHLENKTTIKSIGVGWYLSHEIYGKKNWYVWEVEISAATKPTVLSQNLCCR